MPGMRRGRWGAALAGSACLAAVLLAGACRRPPEAPPAPQIDTDAVISQRNLAWALLENEQDKAAAVEAYRRLAEMVPDEPMAHADLGLALLVQDPQANAAAAEKALAEAARLAPQSARIAYLRGAVAAALDKPAEAWRHLQRAVELDPDLVQARYLLTRVAEALRFDPQQTLLAEGEAERVRREQLEEIVRRDPDNLFARLELLTVLGEAGDVGAFSEHLEVVASWNLIWPAEAGALADMFERLIATARQRVAENDSRQLGVLAKRLKNVLQGVPMFNRSAVALKGFLSLGADIGAEPIFEFLATAVAEPPVRPPAVGLRFIVEPLSASRPLAEGGRGALAVLHRFEPLRRVYLAADARRLAAVQDRRETTVQEVSASEAGAEQPAVLALCDFHVQAEAEPTAPQEPATGPAKPAVHATLEVFWAAADGVHYFEQDADGTLRERTGQLGVPAEALAGAVTDLLPFDIDLEGDVDMLIARGEGPVSILRNNADGTMTPISTQRLPEAMRAGIRFWEWGDLDDDGDADIVAVDTRGVLLWLDNGRSLRWSVRPLAEGCRSSCRPVVADFDNDGRLDVAAVDPEGSVYLVANGTPGAMQRRETGITAQHPDEAVLGAADFDNDGWMDLWLLDPSPRPQVRGGHVHILRNADAWRFEKAASIPTDEGGTNLIAVTPEDLDDDGDMDLLGADSSGRLVAIRNQTRQEYGYVRLVVAAAKGSGNKNNPLGYGGVVEMRAGRHYVRRDIRQPITHIGLGAVSEADIIRITWPNGVPQSMIRPKRDQLVIEPEILKGSCPWLFAWDGERFAFVTDLLWRSPVGMKINAQTTASVVTSEDYVRIGPEQLAPRDGRYELRVTSELWETIFYDAAELWCVDHPGGTAVYVDERFVAPEFPPFELHVVGEVRPVRSARDHRGVDVLDAVEARDGTYLGGFARGYYQGIAEDHFVEVDLGPWEGSPRIRLIATGWIRPTDTSINVALAQGSRPAPRPLAVLVPDGRGGWRTAIGNAGFPAGKIKTIVLDLTGAFVGEDHRVRLATNMEIYFDWIAVAVGEPDVRPTVTRLAPIEADLRFRGFSRTRRPRPFAPALPVYEEYTTAPRWRDLIGWYTRYGDVRELLARPDDRYVIMNAGDELALAFETPPPPPEGWVRTFVLYGDGYVKDGDRNTTASQTTEPLPFHAMTDYPYDPASRPATLRPEHPDWQRYHTRWVTHRAFSDHLRDGR